MTCVKMNENMTCGKEKFLFIRVDNKKLTKFTNLTSYFVADPR